MQFFSKDDTGLSYELLWPKPHPVTFFSQNVLNEKCSAQFAVSPQVCDIFRPRINLCQFCFPQKDLK